MDIRDIYTISYPIATEYTFSSAAHVIFSKINHISVHKGSLNRYKKIEIFFNLKVEINSNQNCRNN
jgi:hypothetical protein